MLHQNQQAFFNQPLPQHLTLNYIKTIANVGQRINALKILIGVEETRLENRPNPSKRSPLLDSANQLLHCLENPISNQGIVRQLFAA